MAGIITSAGIDAGNFVNIPEAVRALYSREVMFQAQPRLRFMQFAKQKTDLQAQRGKSIVFTKYNNLTGGGQIAEDANLEAKGLSTSEVTINVSEHGNAVKVTEYLMRTSLLDTLGDASRLLGSNAATVLDGQLRDTVLASTNVIYGGQATETPPTSAATLALGDGLDTATIKDAVELLASNNSPRIEGDYYVCIAHPHQLRQLRDDPAWIEANKYMGRRQLYMGEAGMYEGVIFIESTQMPELASAATDTKYGTTGGPKVWEATIFGEDAFALGWALPIEMRDDGVIDFGRKRALAWYGIYGYAILHQEHLVRVVTA